MSQETRIIEAANKVFLKYGVDGTTMSQIAEEANISRTSLHYYFRNKERLLHKVLETVKVRIIPALSEIIDAEESIITKIELFINVYIDLIIENPMIPGFLFMEIQRDPEWIISLFKAQNLNFNKLHEQITKEIAEGKIRPFKPEDLFANIIGMTVFPLLGKPVFMEFIFDHDEKDFTVFMMSRKNTILSVINAWLKP